MKHEKMSIKRNLNVVNKMNCHVSKALLVFNVKGFQEESVRTASFNELQEVSKRLMRLSCLSSFFSFSYACSNDDSFRINLDLQEHEDFEVFSVSTYLVVAKKITWLLSNFFNIDVELAQILVNEKHFIEQSEHEDPREYDSNHVEYLFSKLFKEWGEVFSSTKDDNSISINHYDNRKLEIVK